MSFGNNDNFDNYNPNSGSTGFGNTGNQYGQSQGFDDQNIGSQQPGQGNIGSNQSSNWSSGNTDNSQHGSSGRDQYGTNAGSDNFGSSGTDNYGSNTAMGSGTGSSGDSYGNDSRNQGIGYGRDQSSGIGQQQGHKPTMGDKMRGGLEKGIGKMAGKPDLVEKGEERSTGQFDSTRRNL